MPRAAYFCYMQQQRNVLWLVGWFPTSVNPSSGNFIFRHAQAFAAYQSALKNGFGLHLAHFPIYFLGQTKPKNLVETKDFLVWWQAVPQLKLGSFGKIVNYWIYQIVVGYSLNRYRKLHGAPFAIHLHTADKVARPLLQFLKEEPLWLTEHWGIFNNIVFDAFPKRSRVFQNMYRKLWARVTVSAPVSLASQSGMQKYLGGAKPFVLFRNVVDVGIFKPRHNPAINDLAQTSPPPFIFLHVSSLEPRKNIVGLMRAFAALKRNHPDKSIKLQIVGGENEEYLSIARTAALGEGLMHIFQPAVLFFGPRKAVDVADFMQQADALVLFSQMENAPCVISESLCVGLPVIATAVAGISEMIREGINGLLVEAGNETALTEAMDRAMSIFPTLNKEQIALDAQMLYANDAVACNLDLSYRQMIAACAE